MQLPIIAQNISTKNPREAAFLALLAFLRDEGFVGTHLREWKNRASPSPPDSALAYEIAYGSTKMALALDHLAGQLTEKEKLKLKLRERVLIRMAFYQYYYMDRVPIHAVVNETVELAKKYCHPSFVRFLNAILRRVENVELTLPKGDTVPEMSVRYSYPSYFVQELIHVYGRERAVEIMEAGNCPAKIFLRFRSGSPLEDRKKIEKLTGTYFPMGILQDTALVKEVAASPDYYIQNVTPCELIARLAENGPTPTSILDLCASPGGKLIALYDLFPNATLVANDISPEKIQKISENLEKFSIQATVFCSKGEQFVYDQKFDLIVLDVPCSNSGVLNKRPEARWRLSSKEIEQLQGVQRRLLHKAKELLSERGEIWYMTCSILKSENEKMVEWAVGELCLNVRVKKRVFPTQSGWDGGFACALAR